MTPSSRKRRCNVRPLTPTAVAARVTDGSPPLSAGQIASFSGNDALRCVASETTRAVCFGGQPIGPRYLWWNYLHARKERIEEAKATWREGRFPLPSDDRDDIIPLPADHERPLRILNAP